MRSPTLETGPVPIFKSSINTPCTLLPPSRPAPVPATLATTFLIRSCSAVTALTTGHKEADNKDNVLFNNKKMVKMNKTIPFGLVAAGTCSFFDFFP